MADELLPHERFPESQHVASGNGYSDEQRATSLAEIIGMAERLQRVPVWKLTPYTETLLEAERYLAALEALVVPVDLDDEPLDDEGE